MNDYRDLRGAEIISYDIETFDPELSRAVWGREEDKKRGLGPGEFRPETFILGFSLADETGWSEYYNLGHPDHIIDDEEAQVFMDLIHEDPSRSFKPPERQRNLDYLREVMSLNIPKLGENLQYDLGFTEDKEHIAVKGKLMDLMNAEALLNENQGQYNLDFLSMKYLQIHKAKEKPEKLAEKQGWISNTEGMTDKEIARIKRNGGLHDFREFLWRMPFEYVYEYGKGDTFNPIKIWQKQRVQLEAQGLMDVFDRECKMIRFCRMLRHNGMRIDISKRDKYITQLQEKIGEEDSKFRKLYGTVNYNSSKQVAALCDAHGIEYKIKEETGNPILDAAALTKFAHQHPMCQDILNIKGMLKVEGTFLNGAFVRQCTPDNRIHAMYSNTKIDRGEGLLSGTVSGRFSSYSPNLEQVSAHKGDKGTLKDWYTSLCRDIFLPEEGELLSSVDLSGAEVRFIAHYGPLDSPAADDFRKQFCMNPNLDTHQYVADLLGWKGKDGRKRAKTLAFASAYGSGPRHIAEVFDVSLEEAKEIYAIFHAKFPVIQEASREVQRIARVRGYIKTIDGRRRHLADASFAYKMYNSLIQGSVAGYHKIATANAMDAGIYDVLRPLNTVHDENVQSLPRTKEGEEALLELKHLFETAIVLRVPMVSMSEIGETWGTTQEIPDLKRFFSLDMNFDAYFAKESA
jgi:DNA polymerase I